MNFKEFINDTKKVVDNSLVRFYAWFNKREKKDSIQEEETKLK